MDEIADDGIRGPVGARFGGALHQAGAARGFAVRHPTRRTAWVDQPWHGRERLLIRPSPLGAQGRTTGYRWVVVRLSAGPFGAWADVVVPGREQLTGTVLLLTPHAPTSAGIWADDPDLGTDLWHFASSVAPTPVAEHDDTEPWLQLHVRPNAVAWHLRASQLDGARLVQAIDLLERLARYGEAHDPALTARLGTNRGVTATRRTVATGVLVVLLATVLVTTLVGWVVLRGT